MKLPNGARAVADIEKLRDYCLSAQHPEGRHKARVFLSALGMSASDANSLREILLAAAAESNEVSITNADNMDAATRSMWWWFGQAAWHVSGVRGLSRLVKIFLVWSVVTYCEVKNENIGSCCADR